MFTHTYISTDYYKGDKERRNYYKDLIEECKLERSKPDAVSKSSHNKKRVQVVKRIELVGRRVIMSADVFGGKENECYHGLIVGKGKYRQNGKTRCGYKVRWHVGDADYW